ncbi:MAG: hypothetical protein WDZ93_02380 [Candidatus Paceibacterota bacterium]
MTAVIIAATSGTLLVFTTILFRAELRLGRRAGLSAVRGWLDVFLANLYVRLSHLRFYVGTGSLRVGFHYVLNRCINALLRFSEWFGSILKRLQRQNRTIARTIKDEQARSHLDLIAEHKVTTALSEEEREALKRKSLDGEV